MTEATGPVSCIVWRDITAPVGWTPPQVPVEMFGKLEAKRGESKEARAAFNKYANACALALELSADGLTREGKSVKEGDMFIALLDAHLEAQAALVLAKQAAEAAKAQAAALGIKLANLVTDIKEAQVKQVADPTFITFGMMLTWANIARECNAYLVMHGGTDNGAGIDVRCTQAAQVATPRAPKEAGAVGGSGSKGGKETRASAYACALQAQKVAGCPHNVTRTGNKEEGYTYSDHGKVIVGPLTKYLQATYPKQGGALLLDGYDERRRVANGK